MCKITLLQTCQLHVDQYSASQCYKVVSSDCQLPLAHQLPIIISIMHKILLDHFKTGQTALKRAGRFENRTVVVSWSVTCFCKLWIVLFTL